MSDTAPDPGYCTVTGSGRGPFVVTDIDVANPGYKVVIGADLMEALVAAWAVAGGDVGDDALRAENQRLREWRDEAVKDIADYRKLRGAVAITLDQGAVYDERSGRIRPRAWPGAGRPHDLRKPSPLEQYEENECQQTSS